MDARTYIKNHLTLLTVNAAKLDKTAYITTLCHELAVRTTTVRDVKLLTSQVLKREAIESTAIGSGIAFPHARTEAVSEITIALARVADGIPFNAIDKKAVKVIVLMAVPIAEIIPYLNILSHVSKLLKQETVQKAVLQAQSEEALRLLLSA